jgi:glucan endo-1,3-alpha-glucosidase
VLLDRLLTPHRRPEVVTVKPGDKAGKTGLPGGADKLVDNVFVTLFLAAPAQLAIRSGGTEKAFDLQAGVEHVSMPFTPGKQRFVLTRNGKALIDKTAEHEISAGDADRKSVV